MVKVFETTVLGIGPEAQNMIDSTNMLILFGEGAPSDLAEFCFTINRKNLSGPIVTGGLLTIDEMDYHITAVGQVVAKNLSSLGHITISFDGAKTANLPGTLHVEEKEQLSLHQGTKITISY